jgi:hypothetical protein
MQHPDRITPDIRRTGRKLAPAGWLTVYTLAALMFGALAYFAGR